MQHGCLGHDLVAKPLVTTGDRTVLLTRAERITKQTGTRPDDRSPAVAAFNPVGRRPTLLWPAGPGPETTRLQLATR